MTNYENGRETFETKPIMKQKKKGGGGGGRKGDKIVLKMLFF